MTACRLTWTDTDTRLSHLPHDLHACIFHTARAHSRHECRCGLDRYEKEEAA